MSLVYAEFESDLPPSMSDEEIKLLVEKYRNEKHSNANNRENTERDTKRDIIESIDKKYEA